MVLRLRHIALLLCLISLSVIFVSINPGAANQVSAQASDPVIVYRLSGEITGVTANMISDVLATAQRTNARLVAIELATPGGEVMAVQSIMQMFATSEIPVLIYVPTAAVAVSGGTYLLMASHIAGMGPTAQIGSCQPVVGVVPTYEPKYLEFVVTLMTSHAHLHERNETTAERFIIENLNLGASDAQTYGATEFVAASLPAFLSEIEEYTLIKRGLETSDPTFRLVLTTDLGNYSDYQSWNFDGISSAPQINYLPNLGLVFLAFLAHPVVNFILLQIGIWGFIFALNSPGQFGEIISVACIILALVGMGIIGIPVAGILLMALGGGLIIIEAKTDIGFAGLAGIVGVVCFALGGIFFLPPSQWMIPTESMWVFQGISVVVAGLFAGLFGYAIMKAAEARRLTSELEPEKMIGVKGYAETLLDPDGRVRAMGETWTATAEDPPIKVAEPIEIVRLEGIRLIVRRTSEFQED